MTATKVNGGLEIDPTIAGTVVGTYWFLMLIGRLSGGLIAGKFSSRVMLTSVASLGIVLVIAGIFSPTTIEVNMPVFKSDISLGFAKVPISIMFFVLAGLSTSVMWGNIFNLATSGLGKYIAAASGFFMVMVAGGGILPALQGGTADFVGFINSYWIVVAGFAYILFYALIGHKNINKNISV